MDVTLLTGLLKALPTIASAGKEALEQLSSAPSSADQKAIIEYVRFLDQRRVFSVPYNVEVFECCIASLSSFKDESERVLVQLEHEIARGAVEQITHDIRRFLDRWQAAKAWRPGWGMHAWSDPPHRPDGREQESQFFLDLGELRGGVRLIVQLLCSLAPKAKAPNLLGALSQEH